MTTKEKVRTILRQHPSYNIQVLCDALDLSRPTYYVRMSKENWKTLEQNRVDEIYYLLKNLSKSEIRNLPKVVKHGSLGKPKKKRKADPSKALFDRLKKEK